MKVLGVDVRFCASFGGETGQVLRALVAAESLELQEVRVAGSNGAYVHDRRSGEREELAVMASTGLSRHELDELYGAALTAALDSDVCVLGGPGPLGTVPTDLYRRLACDIGANGGTVVADLSGEPLQAAMDGRAAVIKVSHEELLDDGRAADDSVESLLGAISGIAEVTGGVVACSRAERPALAVAGGRALRVTSPPLEPVERRGAGDSFTAGLAAGLAYGFPFEDALRLAGGAGAMNVTRRGLGSGRRDQIEALAKRVEIAEVRRA